VYKFLAAVDYAAIAFASLDLAQDASVRKGPPVLYMMRFTWARAGRVSRYAHGKKKKGVSCEYHCGILETGGAKVI
jgi:hypothetical protein